MRFNGLASLGGLLLAVPLLTVSACGDDDGDGAPVIAGGAAGEGGPGPGEAGTPSSGGSGGTGSLPEGGAGGAPLELDACEPSTGEGTTHERYLDADETWTAEGSPHLAPDGLSFDTTLTLEPCAVVLVGAGQDILVGGKLIARGEVVEATADDPVERYRFVRIERLDDEAWGAIASDSSGGEIELDTALVDGGGGVVDGSHPQHSGMIVVRGEPVEPLAPRVSLKNTRLTGSASQGVLLTNNVAFADDSAVAISGSGGYPILVGARAMGTVPTGSYLGNAHDMILVSTGERLGDGGDTDVTLKNVGVPYLMGSELDASGLEVGTGNGSAASLTVEPGVELRFPQLFGLSVEGPDGTLIATGSEAEPIVFTSDAASPQAGDWLGLQFTGAIAPGTALDFVRIAFGGALGTGVRSYSCGTPAAEPMDQFTTMGAVYLSLETAPAQSFITNSWLEDSASNGIDRGYTGDPIDFLDTNQLTNIAFCAQTEPKPLVGACPAEPACPAVD